VSAIVLVIVLALLLIGVLRGRGRRDPVRADTRSGKLLVAVGGAVIPAVVVVALFAITVDTLPATSPPRSPTQLTIEVVGHRWFWEVRYPARQVKTANEIHIPTRRAVDVKVTTDDVIHSFWVPRLNRKIDMIPGRLNSILLEADRPGVYRGQCAEFCGLQHANMAFLVVAHEPRDFDAWLARQARPAVEPRTSERERGRQIFLGSSCAFCHRVAGTDAAGDLGPDLTHFGSRRTIAAGTIPNTRGDLAAWILDPQHVKPGNLMPSSKLAGQDLEALVDYLESLE
jgi:cytochrome c oxidase subunit 2